MGSKLESKLEWIRGEGAGLIEALDVALRPILIRWTRARECSAGQVLLVLILATDELFREMGVLVPRRLRPPDGDLIDEGALNRFGNRLADHLLRETVQVLRRFPRMLPTVQYLAVRFFRVKLSVGVAHHGPTYLEGTRGGRVERTSGKPTAGDGAGLAPVVPHAADSR